MPSKYSWLPNCNSKDEDADSASSLLGEESTAQRGHWRSALRASILTTIALVFYSLVICWITKLVVLGSHHPHLPAPASSFPHPDEKKYAVTNTGQHGDSWTSHLVYGKPSPEVDEAWYDLLKPFNTRVPANRYEATMNNRTSVRVADGSDDPDYYVTLTVYHELHCLMRFRRFLDPEYYANKTWEEQADDKGAMGHYRHCLLSLLESVLCNGDTSMRTFHWDPNKPAPKPDSLAERKCVDWDWLYNWTLEHSFLLQDGLLNHPKFGRLDANLKPVKSAE